ncbi:MAG: transposase [Steroidobacteraceae bacterium]
MPYNNLRIGRVSIPGQTYLVTTVTLHRQHFFDDFVLGRIVVDSMRMLDRQGASRTLAFVVMPDHVHWLLDLNQTRSLTQIIKSFKGRSATLIGKKLCQPYKIWQPSFHDHAVRTDESLVEMARYVVMNPVRAGLVKSIGDYPLWDCIWME